MKKLFTSHLLKRTGLAYIALLLLCATTISVTAPSLNTEYPSHCVFLNDTKHLEDEPGISPQHDWPPVTTPPVFNK